MNSSLNSWWKFTTVHRTNVILIISQTLQSHHFQNKFTISLSTNFGRPHFHTVFFIAFKWHYSPNHSGFSSMPYLTNPSFLIPVCCNIWLTFFHFKRILHWISTFLIWTNNIIFALFSLLYLSSTKYQISGRVASFSPSPTPSPSPPPI